MIWVVCNSMNDRWTTIFGDSREQSDDDFLGTGKQSRVPIYQIRLALVATSLGMWVVILGLFRALSG